MPVYILLLAVISFTPPGTVQGQECGIGNFPRREQFLLNEDIDYQLPNGTGYLVIVPQLKFDCHGFITNWHALTYFNTADTALDALVHDITFQLWRPSAEDNRVYSFVGSNIAQFFGNDIRAGRTILEDGTLFFNLTSTPPVQDRLQFQPGDVIGWYIHTGVQATDQPLSIVYSCATSGDENAVDMFSRVISDSYFAATPPPCDVAVCSANTTLIPSVIPYITVEYETLSNTPGTGRIGPPLCVNNSSPPNCQQECGIENFPRREQFLLIDHEAIDYQLPNTSVFIGYLVIVPQLKFDCHGTITNWHALTYFNAGDAALSALFHDITFQLWRPSAEDNRVYSFVGSNIAQFAGNDIRAGRTILEDGTKVSNLTSTPPAQERLQFQPGDVIGWYIHTGVQAIDQPLSIVYRHATSGDDNAVDMFSTVISDSDLVATPPPCDLAICSTNTTLIPSVIPYITVEYETLSNPSDAGRLGPPLCVNNSSLLDDCPVTTPGGTSTTAPPSPLTMTPVDPNTDSGSQIFTLPVIGALAATGAVILIALVIFIIILVLCVRGRTCILFSGSAKKRQASFRDNPTYTSPDDFIRGETPPTPGDIFHPAVQHYQANNGALYAVPDANHSLTNSTTKLDPSHIFDGECYATTYQTNGQCHVYQELTEMPPKFSQSTLHITKQELPDLPIQHHRNSHGSLQFKNFQNSVPRFSISTGTIPAAQFPYTLPNTPAPSHPYLEAVDSRPLQQNRTPDNTPPHSADLPLQGNAPARKLFHAIDDEGYHVPTHEERMQFLGNSSTEELYSRLSRPHARSRDSREVNFFEQSDLYWEPPTSTPELYNQLARRKYREIHRNQIHVITALGSGHFGAVSRGYWEVPGGRVDVAIKFLQPGSKEEDEALFLQEAAIMGQFLHPNIVKLHGVVTVGEPMMIVLELMPKGDLKNYLKELNSRVPNLPLNLPELFLNFCRQISYGMNYLSNKQFIHRDLAARNILLTDDLTCKIGDFGMTRALNNNETYQSRGGMMPLKWTAPEALNYCRFTPGSDVWSYGIVLFEIWSLGQQPFKRVSEPSKLMSLVNSGHCQPPPPGCPRAIYQLMVNCWHPIDESRPRFSQICDYLSRDDDTLLNWDHADRIVSPSVTHIGAPLTDARNLYPDLQFCYDNDTEV